MGRRSRKRSASVSPLPRAPRPVPGIPTTPAPQGRRRPRLDEAPAPPWSPFPLVELCILVALVLVALGFFSGGSRGTVELGAGLTLVSLASLELTIREHFAGYRSHTTLLAGAGAVGAAAVLFFLAGVPRVVIVVVGAGLFGLLFRVLRSSFITRSGVGFRA